MPSVQRYEFFTDRIRKVMKLASRAALVHDQEHIGTEHLLLGLVMEGEGVACNVLKNLGLTLEQVRTQTEKLIKVGLQRQIGPHIVVMGKLRYTPLAKKVIEFAVEDARSLRHKYVGTEHLLLGMLREQEGPAGQVLGTLGLKLEQVREETLNVLGQGKQKTATSTNPGPTIEERAEMANALDALSLVLSAAAVKIREGGDYREGSPLAKEIRAALRSLPRQSKL